MSGLQWGWEVNLIVEGFSLGRDVVGHHRSVRFVKNPDAVVVYRNVRGRFDESSRPDLWPQATVEIRGGEPAVGKLMSQAQNQLLWQRADFAVGRFGGNGCNDRLLLSLSSAADQKAAEESSTQACQTKDATDSS